MADKEKTLQVLESELTVAFVGVKVSGMIKWQAKEKMKKVYDKIDTILQRQLDEANAKHRTAIDNVKKFKENSN